MHQPSAHSGLREHIVLKRRDDIPGALSLIERDAIINVIVRAHVTV